jgi:hypothetical protein
MKKLLIGLLLGGALLGGFVLLAFGHILKLGIESAGYAALGVPVSVGLVTLSPLSGRGTVRDLVVANPKGFSGPYAFRADAVSVTLRPRSLLAGDVVVESIVVRNPTVRLEGGNLAQLKAKASSGGDGGGSGGGRSVRIRSLEVTGASLTVPGGLSVPLPDVHLKDVGGRSALQQLLGSFAAKGAGSAVLGGLQGLLKRL